MKKLVTFFLFFFIANLQAQVAIEPEFPTANKEITITIDVGVVATV